MQLHTLFDNVTVKTSFNLVNANSTQNGSSFDTLQYRRAGFVFSYVTGAATTANFQVQDSPDNSVWTNVTGATLVTPIAAGTASSEQTVNIDLAKRQRYIRAQLICTGTNGQCTGTFLLTQDQYAGVSPAQDVAPLTV